MPSTTNKGLEVQTTGSNSGTWGEVLNDSMISYVDLMLGGTVTVALTSSPVTLSAAQARYAIVRFTGTLLGNITVTTPCLGFTIFDNATTGSFTVTVQYTGAVGSTQVVEQSVVTLVAFDATNGARGIAQYPNLAGINSLTGTGILKRTGTNTWSLASGVTDLATTTANRLFGTDNAGAPGVATISAPLSYASSALSLPIGCVIQSIYAQNADVFTTSTTIPVDNSIPQNTEGAELVTATITPRLITSRMRIRFRMMAGVASNGGGGEVAALFQDSTANALSATVFENANLGDPNEYYRIKQIVLEYEHSPATVSAITYKIRVGPNNGSVLTVNGAASARIFGGVSQATLIVEELYAV